MEVTSEVVGSGNVTGTVDLDSETNFLSVTPKLTFVRVTSNGSPGGDDIIIDGPPEDFRNPGGGTFSHSPEPGSILIWTLLAAIGLGVGWHRRRKAS